MLVKCPSWSCPLWSSIFRASRWSLFLLSDNVLFHDIKLKRTHGEIVTIFFQISFFAQSSPQVFSVNAIRWRIELNNKTIDLYNPEIYDQTCLHSIFLRTIKEKNTYLKKDLNLKKSLTVKEFFHFLDDVKAIDLCQSFQKRFHAEEWLVTNDEFHHHFCWAGDWFGLQIIKLFPFNSKLSAQGVPKIFLPVQQGRYFI